MSIDPITRNLWTGRRLRLSAASMTPTERALIDALTAIRVAMAGHIAQIVFGEHDVETARRLAHRHLQKLQKEGLIRRLENTSRSHRERGRPGSVYVLTSAGLTLVARLRGIGAEQRMAWQPAPSRLDHWLDIADLYTALAVDARQGGPAIREFRAEGDAQRLYRDPAGRIQLIRPDVLVRLASGDLELSWFVEIDRGTEGQRVIADKCDAYRRYELSGTEQQQFGIFPGVVFIAPDDSRAALIAGTIAAQPDTARDLFRVTTKADALTALCKP